MIITDKMRKQYDPELEPFTAIYASLYQVQALQSTPVAEWTQQLLL